MNRLPLGPHVLDVEEAVYAAVAATGLRGTDVVAVTNLINWQLVGAARAQITDAAEERHTGTSTEAYWTSRVSFWTTHFDYERFPTMAQIWEAGGFDDEAGYDADRGIARLLDAIEVMIEPASCCRRSTLRATRTRARPTDTAFGPVPFAGSRGTSGAGSASALPEAHDRVGGLGPERAVVLRLLHLASRGPDHGAGDRSDGEDHLPVHGSTLVLGLVA